ncbi:peptidoglycan DD-metalloendopeptidase family protein [Treponema parvum]|uniref:peptidoglycan DD-metalloendopeptidase family protein n=1 Tax=Treponema parvum TaxID=138851 RepID=UPI001AEC206E|nr:peptidoglycan DD-metalloendopeptidase family protein [Treponema parvum]QTQ15681.1 M23 family metallopeptidase [Treponema parvum]
MRLNTYKILIRSLISFCAAVILTAVVLEVKSFSKADSGQGGLETPEMPTVSAEEENSDYVITYQSYRVDKGDMIGIIAEKFGITQDTIISVNNIRQSRLLQIGQYLKIPNMPGIMYCAKGNGETVLSVAEKYKVDAKKCALVNNLSEGSSLSDGQTIFIPDAELDRITRQEINGDLFMRPVRRYYISSTYGWRLSPFTGKRSFHSGIDMSAPAGTSVYAALGGVVSFVGYNNVYGNYIIISHHSGYKTLYGHLSATLVLKGQSVSPANVIGRVGNTGLSTGPHLHFTVFKNGRTVNPFNLLK